MCAMSVFLRKGLSKYSYTRGQRNTQRFAYSVVTLVLVVEIGRVYVVTHIPVHIYQTSIICLRADDLLLRDFVSLSVLVLAFTH